MEGCAWSSSLKIGDSCFFSGDFTDTGEATSSNGGAFTGENLLWCTAMFTSRSINSGRVKELSMLLSAPWCSSSFLSQP